MSQKLSDLQKQFTYDCAKLILYIFDDLGLSCTLGEAERPEETAARYAAEGIGTSNSLHRERLALDLHLYDENGVYLTRSEDYAEAGEYWKSLNAMNRWGGDFKSRPDGNHFSRTPDGIRA
jgi:hypothetical protein